MQMYHDFNQLIDTWKSNQGTALIYGSGRKALSYAELARMIRAEQEDVKKSGIRSELIVTDHEAATLIRIFADVLAGCDVVLVDENTPDEMLFLLAELAGTESVHAVDPELREELSAYAVRGKKEVLTESCEKEGRLLFFTSGTTSSSKAVVLTSESLLTSSWSGQCMLPCGPGDIILSLLPLSHVFGFVCTMLWGLTYGAAVALGRGTRFLLEDCAFFQPTILPVVPSLAKMLMSRGCLGNSLKVALIGAAPLDESAVKELQQAGIKVYLGYGLTETSSGLAITQDQKDPYALYPCPGADICIEADGEVSVKTPCMMKGYLDLTSGKLVPMTDERLYTGDLGTLDEKGALHLKGRKKDMLVLPDGTKIFCPEYEEALSSLLGTDDVAVILKEGRPAVILGGKQDDRLNAVWEIVRQYNEKLTRSVRICDVLFFGRPLPRTATGKIRRWEIDGGIQ